MNEPILDYAEPLVTLENLIRNVYRSDLPKIPQMTRGEIRELLAKINRGKHALHNIEIYTIQQLEKLVDGTPESM